MEKITLTQPHTHDGVLHAIGAEIDVLLHDAEWLVAAGVARIKQGVQPRTKDNPPASDAVAVAAEPAAAPAAADTAAPQPAAT